VAQVVLLEDFHRPDRLPHLPFFRVAVMHRLAVHNVKTANSAFLAQFAVQRGGDIVSHWFYYSFEF
jgi:hypothetical protein